MERMLKPNVKYGRDNLFEDVQFYSSNHWFANHILKDYARSEYRKDGCKVLDIACGPGKVPFLLAKQIPSLEITAVDCSEEMLRIARKSSEGLNIDVKYGRIPGAELGTFDMVLSKDFIHYLHDPSVFWKEVSRFSNQDAAVYIAGFVRPENKDAARDLVERVMPTEKGFMKMDFFTSLCSGFTMDEVRNQVADLGLDVERSSEAHFIVKGQLKQQAEQSATFINKPEFPIPTSYEGDFTWN